MVELAGQAEPRLHELVDDPETADMILFVGRWGYFGQTIVDSPLTAKYPEKCFAYCDNDNFATLLPGIYASTEAPRIFGFLHRMESQLFVDFPNPAVYPRNAEKKYLFTFAGRSTAMVRKRLYKLKWRRPDVLVENSSSYNHWGNQPDRAERQEQFARTIAESHFVLCPRGASAGSYRLFEVMRMGIAPVIISDGVLLPEGPDWDSFALRVPEGKIARLEEILEKHVGESAERGRLARAAYEQWFAAPVAFNHLIAACERIRARRLVPERWVQRFWGLMLWRLRMKSGARDKARAAVLWGFRVMGRKFTYELDPDQGGRLGKY
jgi:hypothetical protein